MPTTLIVDDEMDMRMLVRITLDLSNMGFNIVAEATNGREALDMFSDVGPMDIVVLDNRMPEMSGIDAARILLERSPDQIVVLYSAHLDKSVETEAEAIGIRACVSKTDLEQLPDLLIELLEGQAPDQG